MDERYLQLAIAEGGGPGMITRLLEPGVDPGELMFELRHGAPRGLPAPVRRRLADPELPLRATAMLRLAAARGIAVWTPDDAEYPERLRAAPLRPLVLFARGDPRALAAPTTAVAVVGSRTPTPYGIAAAQDFSQALATAGCAIWSGLAYGIDGQAHVSALDVAGRTVAVLAGGLDRTHPVGHESLALRILDAGGLWLSESPPGVRPLRGHFPRRNRILAAAVDAVLVVEAGERSGTMHTARFAVDSGVPVFALPGPYTSPRSRGCHRLLEDGADLAADPATMLRRLGLEFALRGRAAHARALDLGADEQRILDRLQGGPRPIDFVQREAGLPDARFLDLLFALVARGAIVKLAGDLVALGRTSG